MVIGLLTTSYPRSATDPAGCFVADRAAALRGQGHQLQVLAAGAAAPDDVVRITSALFSGPGAPELFESTRGADLWSLWTEALRFSATLLREAQARQASWTAVESHWLIPCGLVGAMVARGRPHRAHAHAGDIALMERLPFGASLARALLGSGASLVFVDHRLRRRFAALAGCPESRAGEVAAMPVASGHGPARDVVQLRRDLGWQRPTVVGVGRLVPIKGFATAVLALGRLPRTERPDLVLLGEGPERDRLRDLAARTGVQLRLVGRVDRGTVARHVAAAVCVVAPSLALANRTEGAPLAPREALAAFTPVIASATGGLLELASTHPHLVTLVPPGDRPALAAAIAARLA